MIKGELVSRMEALRASREPFVTATVVRAAKPTSVRPGDSALVLADGTIEGFVGGVCAQSSVRLYAARALETGDAMLLRLVPGVAPADAPATPDGVVVAHNPCLSGGSLEIFLEPQLVAPRIVIVGDTPIARALAELARSTGYEVARSDPAAEDMPAAGVTAADAALVVASHGEAEESALVHALNAGVPYIALVASPRRGHAVRDSLDVPEALRERLHTPAGLDIGARTPIEIAISILAQIIASRTAQPHAATAIDPVCGMEVVVGAATPSFGGEYFCCEGCRSKYAASCA
jgi:xanthine dehydrogenase accessory factor